jgi:hypothetical protein
MKSGETNPFDKMAQYGLTLELPGTAPPIIGPVVRNLLQMSSRVVPQR